MIPFVTRVYETDGYMHIHVKPLSVIGTDLGTFHTRQSLWNHNTAGSLVVVGRLHPVAVRACLFAPTPHSDFPIPPPSHPLSANPLTCPVAMESLPRQGVGSEPIAKKDLPLLVLAPFTTTAPITQLNLEDSLAVGNTFRVSIHFIMPPLPLTSCLRDLQAI